MFRWRGFGQRLIESPTSLTRTSSFIDLLGRDGYQLPNSSLQSDDRFQIQKPTFETANLKGRVGSIPVIWCGLQASHWKTLYLRPRYLTFVT